MKKSNTTVESIVFGVGDVNSGIVNDVLTLRSVAISMGMECKVMKWDMQAEML